MTNHEYDGIREYDNPTPGWWHAIFFGTVIFAVFYLAIFSWSPAGTTPQEDLQARQTEEYAALFGKLGELKGDAATINQMRIDPKMMQVANGMFQSTCSACHGRDGGGINGVNLTDNHYKNIKVLGDLFTVISNGAANGAMPSWRNTIQQNQRVLLAAYVANLRGTTPAKPKDPEGVVIPPWEEGTSPAAPASK
jgi:cytochrome c oxidase cbb3-type subunit 3